MRVICGLVLWVPELRGLPLNLLPAPGPLVMLPGFCYCIDFYHFQGVGINISSGNVNQAAERRPSFLCAAFVQRPMGTWPLLLGLQLLLECGNVSVPQTIKTGARVCSLAWVQEVS